MSFLPILAVIMRGHRTVIEQSENGQSILWPFSHTDPLGHSLTPKWWSSLLIITISTKIKNIKINISILFIYPLLWKWQKLLHQNLCNFWIKRQIIMKIWFDTWFLVKMQKYIGFILLLRAKYILPYFSASIYSYSVIFLYKCNFFWGS